MRSETAIPVRTGRAYEVHLGRGVLAHTGALAAAAARGKNAAVVTDTNVAPLYGARVCESLRAAGFTVHMHAFPAGEASKNLDTLKELYAFFAGCDLTRADLVVALGGGVVGDTAGFAAASWMRGVDFIQIPTTLLAQVDSSVGGKTAVDLPQGKNLAGAFWQPRLVVCDPDTLQTLDAENIACGMGEIVKHACIADARLFETLEQTDDLQAALPGIIARNIEIKRDVVQDDEREAGRRMLLNFGHTIGHAIEKCLHYTGISHGAAVAAGMAAITAQAERQGLTAPGTAARIAALLRKFGLPDRTALPLADLVAAARGDKKRAGGKMHLVLLKTVGEAYVHTIPVEELPAFFGL